MWMALIVCLCFVVSFVLSSLVEYWVHRLMHSPRKTKIGERHLDHHRRNDAQGVLQDIHWANGYMGYFSTYALGNLISAQLWETINRNIANLDDQIRKGDFSELLGWLRNNIYRHGQKYEPQPLIEMVTGSKIMPEPYVRYLTKKYSEIYGL